jgi:predicted Zn-dependent protease
MIKSLPSLALVLLLFSCFEFAQAQSRPCSQTCNGSITHSYLECIASSGSGSIINGLSVFADIGRESFGTNIRVSKQEEVTAGEELLKQAKEKYKFITNGSKHQTLQVMLQRLVSRVQKLQGYTFKVFLIETETINAWTSGGMIFVTTAIYDFCNNEDEIASIIGHEISHNLLGHINARLRDIKIASRFGLPGIIAGSIGMLATQSIGQEDEAHSDLLGVDIAYAAGYRVCEGISLWSRMAEKSGEFSELANFLNSHPHPDKRAICIKDHLNSKYSLKCQN